MKTETVGKLLNIVDRVSANCPAEDAQDVLNTAAYEAMTEVSVNAFLRIMKGGESEIGGKETVRHCEREEKLNGELAARFRKLAERFAGAETAHKPYEVCAIVSRADTSALDIGRRFASEEGARTYFRERVEAQTGKHYELRFHPSPGATQWGVLDRTYSNDFLRRE